VFAEWTAFSIISCAVAHFGSAFQTEFCSSAVLAEWEVKADDLDIEIRDLAAIHEEFMHCTQPNTLPIRIFIHRVLDIVRFKEQNKPTVGWA